MSAALLVRFLLWLWLGAAVYLGYTGALQRLPAFAAPLLGLWMSALVVLLYHRVATLREWVDGLELRSLLIPHFVRFTGVYFLILYHRAELSREFALVTGIVELAAAVMLLPILFAPVEPATRRRAIQIWNGAAAANILLLGIRWADTLGAGDVIEVARLDSLPLCLLPLFLYPLLLASHVLVALRLRR